MPLLRERLERLGLRFAQCNTGQKRFRHQRARQGQGKMKPVAN
jgi:hypothetical protein